MTNTPSKAVGFIITWQSPTTVTLGTLRTALVAANLDAKLARDLGDYSKLARTARQLARRNGHTGEKRIARPVEGQRARQLTREQLVHDGLVYDREAVLKLNEHGRLDVDTSDVTLIDAARDAFDDATSKRNASDVTRLIKRVVEHAGSDLMPLRDQGGVYFVPSGHAVVAQLDTLLSQIGGALRKFAVTIGDGSADSIARVVTDYLVGEIDELKKSVAELDADARADVKARRVERLAELREKLTAYGSLLSASAGIVQTALDTADTLIVQKLAVATV